MTDDMDIDFQEPAPSKTALKREMTHRQELGEALCQLSPGELKKIPIDSADLLDAIEESRRIRHHSAQRRHRQYIGKLMRKIDPAPIQQALDALHHQRLQEAQSFKDLEVLRDQLVSGDDQTLATVIDRFPHADRQHLRQLTRDARRELKAGKPPAASRRLFRYLRELQSPA